MSSSALVGLCWCQTLQLQLIALFYLFIFLFSSIMLVTLWSDQNPLVHLPGVVVAHYLQSITPALALGGELVYHRRPGEEGSVMSLVGRYTGRHGACLDGGHSHSANIIVAQNGSLWFCRQQLHRHADARLSRRSRLLLPQSE